jgi:hypothetical protein
MIEKSGTVRGVAGAGVIGDLVRHTQLVSVFALARRTSVSGAMKNNFPGLLDGLHGFRSVRTHRAFECVQIARLGA